MKTLTETPTSTEWTHYKTHLQSQYVPNNSTAFDAWLNRESLKSPINWAALFGLCVCAASALGVIAFAVWVVGKL